MIPSSRLSMVVTVEGMDLKLPSAGWGRTALLQSGYTYLALVQYLGMSTSVVCIKQDEGPAASRCLHCSLCVLGDATRNRVRVHKSRV